MNITFWKNKKVLITGHTGFKGSWMIMLLKQLGAEVIGFSLSPPTEPSLFKLCDLSSQIKHTIADIRDISSLEKVILESNPDIIFHMAAQPLVRESYRNPHETYEVNIMGTSNILNAIKKMRVNASNKVLAFVNITTDKVYDNYEWVWPYRENDRLGGKDPYSNSKACSEIITSSYAYSFFNSKNWDKHKTAIATVRAGNVIGGGDWSYERLIPDFYRSVIENKDLKIRNPNSTRPWQFVLDCLDGYLRAAEFIYQRRNALDLNTWNFGPSVEESIPVDLLVTKLKELAITDELRVNLSIEQEDKLVESSCLMLDASKAKSELKWNSKYGIDKTLKLTHEWYSSYLNKTNHQLVCEKQIKEFILCQQKI